MKKQVVLLRVGIDAGCGGIQGPLFEDGTFEFVCIPDNKRVSVHTYGNMVGRNGHAHVGYFPESRRTLMTEQTVHVDPEWETFTYGDPTTPKRSLRHLQPGDLLAFYCGLQEWDAVTGWNGHRRPALYLAGYFEVALAGMAGDFDKKVLRSEFGKNFHVRYSSVFDQQKNDLVLVKGGPGSRLFSKASQISVEGKDRAGKPLKVLSPAMQKVFGSFGGHVSAAQLKRARIARWAGARAPCQDRAHGSKISEKIQKNRGNSLEIAGSKMVSLHFLSIPMNARAAELPTGNSGMRRKRSCRRATA